MKYMRKVSFLEKLGKKFSKRIYTIANYDEYGIVHLDGVFYSKFNANTRKSELQRIGYKNAKVVKWDEPPMLLQL